MEKKVIIVNKQVYQYPKEIPFRPSKSYPELINSDLSSSDNDVYDMVREGFYLSGYDIEHYGMEEWNPLSVLINPGNRVLLKPNLVMEENHIKDNGTDCLYTQPAVVAAVLDYVILALKGKGSIVVGDAPMQECDFDKLISDSGYADMISFYKEKLLFTDISIDLVDFRGLISRRINGVNHSVEVQTKGRVIDLGKDSAFVGKPNEYYDKIRITNYDPAYLRQHHNETTNEYFINEHILQADVVINMPKPKTHRKAGVTISLKNLVGINCRKEYLPHHANGSIAEGGDEYENKNCLKTVVDCLNDKRNYLSQTAKLYKISWCVLKLAVLLEKISRLIGKDKYYEGSWHGNDTISRTIVDLNKILFYADKSGVMQESKQRKYLIVADMIISGEKEGPVAPTAKNVGIIAMGEDPVCFDEAILMLMGAKREYINTLNRAREYDKKYILTERESLPIIISNNEKWNGKKTEELDAATLLYFYPTLGWEKVFLNKK